MPLQEPDPQPIEIADHLRPEQCALIVATAMRDGDQDELLHTVREIGRNAYGDEEFDQLAERHLSLLNEMAEPTMAQLFNRMAALVWEYGPIELEDARKLAERLGGQPEKMLIVDNMSYIVYSFMDSSDVAIALTFCQYTCRLTGSAIHPDVEELERAYAAAEAAAEAEAN